MKKRKIEIGSLVVFFYLVLPARSQHVQIQAVPPTVKYLENDLVIICSITNPSSLIAIISLELLRNASGSFQTIVSIKQDQKPHWINTLLERRATVSGSVNDTNSAELKFSIDNKNVLCPEDFTTYKCNMSGYVNIMNSNYIVQNEDQITITYTSKPTVLNEPTVQIYNSGSDTKERRFPDKTVLKLTCQGEIGTNPKKIIRWCIKKASQHSFVVFPLTTNHTVPSRFGCQYTRSSTIVYNITSEDEFTQFLCETGDYELCGTGSIIRYVNISNLGKSYTEGTKVTSRPSISTTRTAKTQTMMIPTLHQVSTGNSTSSVNKHGLGYYLYIYFGVAIGSVLILFAAVCGCVKRKLNRGNAKRITSLYTYLQIYEGIRESVALHRFVNHVITLLKNDEEELTEEYQALLQSSERITAGTAISMGIPSKNRSGVVPYEFNRVKLQKRESSSSNNYINASIVLNGLYIMTQYPLQRTTADFWQMLWEQNVPSIIALTEKYEEIKNECYYPSKDCVVRSFGRIDVELLATFNISEDLTLRNFKLSRGKQTKNVGHFHVTNLDISFLQEQIPSLVSIVEQTNKGITIHGPRVVHGSCSDMDLSGVYIVVDFLMNSILSGSDSIDVYGTTLKVLKERMSSIHSEDQYSLIYTCLQRFVQNSTEVKKVKPSSYENVT
uniref:Tyrosine-protein phosphatase domain-containing protein n=1 Tax=Magallana gigas TaxID=29159 RepID=A0A8W8J9L4_MAGGI